MSSELELLRQRITDLEAENAKLRQIIEENAKRDAENGEHKVRIEELEKNSADISTENAELKAELAKLRHDFEELKTRSYASSSNLTRPQQSQHVTNMQNSCSVGEEDICLVTAVPQPDAEPERHLASNDIPDPVIDQCVSIAKQHVADNSDIKSMEE
jgi:predicted RNase H-like nuclease (RuvC/YqgF family)